MPEARIPLPQRSTPPPRKNVDSRVLLNTGNGRGKTTSSVGLLARGWARGWRCAMMQFIKGGRWQVGERALAEHLGIEWHTLGDGFTWDSKDIDASAELNVQGWKGAKDKLQSGHYDLIVLDELTYVINYGWLDIADAIDGIRYRWPTTNVVITGRDAPDELIEIADTVTDMGLIKHAYDDGIRARKGIEY